MKKSIILVMSGYVAKNKYGYTGNAKLVNMSFDIDLDALSPAAKVIAKNICTTERRDDLSKIWLEGESLKELAIKEGKMEEYKMYEKAYKNLDKPIVRVWDFDLLRGYESPEEYLNNQVKEMKRCGWLKIKHSTFNDNIDFPL